MIKQFHILISMSNPNQPQIQTTSSIQPIGTHCPEPLPSIPSIPKPSVPTLHHISFLPSASRKQIYKLINEQVQIWRQSKLLQIQQQQHNNQQINQQIIERLCGWMGQMLEILFTGGIIINVNIGEWRQNINNILSTATQKVQSIITILLHRQQHIHANLSNYQKLVSLAQQFSRLLNYLYNQHTQHQNYRVSALRQIIQADFKDLQRVILGVFLAMEFQPHFASVSVYNGSKNIRKWRNNNHKQRQIVNSIIEQDIQLDIYSDESFTPNPKFQKQYKSRINRPYDKKSKNNKKHDLIYLLSDEQIIDMRERFSDVWDGNIRNMLISSINMELFGSGNNIQNNMENNEVSRNINDICNVNQQKILQMQPQKIQLNVEQLHQDNINKIEQMQKQNNINLDTTQKANNQVENQINNEQYKQEDYRQNTSQQQQQIQHIQIHEQPQQQQYVFVHPTKRIINNRKNISINNRNNVIESNNNNKNNGCYTEKYYISSNSNTKIQNIRHCYGNNNSSTDISTISENVTHRKKRNTFQIHYIQD